MGMHDRSTLGLVVLHALSTTCLALTAEAPVRAQAPGQEAGAEEETVAERCAGSEFREFDFWLGRWEVRNPEGELAGHNEIRREAGGCGLLERWQGVGGGTGISVNTFDAELGRWTQRWVGGGATLWLEGGLEDGPEGRRMVLEGPRPRSTPQGEVLDRITWQPLDGERVRQVWEISPDGGESWDEIFRGLYSRAAGSEAIGAVELRSPEELEWRDAPTGASFANRLGPGGTE